MHDLAAYPGIVESLRKEMRDVLKKHDGVMTVKALFDMKLMDSVMNESQRLNPAFLCKYCQPSMLDGVLIVEAHSAYLQYQARSSGTR